MTRAVPCLDDNELQALTQGLLSADELARAHEHLDGCLHCRRLAAQLAEHASLSSQADVGQTRVDEPFQASDEAARAPAGASFGRYQVLGPLGRGGMGQVLLAYDSKLDRKVALKRVRAPKAPDPLEARGRLLEEARAMARVAHPNVLTVHDAEDFDGEVVIAMEYVEGRTLRRWLKEPWDWREILTVFCAAGEGLLAAHRAGLTHRDFKPDNVLVGKDGRVRVTDFGLARAETPMTHTAPPARRATSCATPCGTPGYVSPEALRGEQGPLSDQFSFFVSLHEALFGERPTAEPSLRAQVDAKRRPKGLRHRGGRVPERLRRLILTGLSDDPAQRFPSMADAVAALRSVSQRARRRGRLAIATAGLAAITLVFIWYATRPEPSCADSERRLASAWGEGAKQKLRVVFFSTGDPRAEVTFTQTVRVLDGWAMTWARARAQTCGATEILGERPAEPRASKLRCLEHRWMDFEALIERLSTPAVPLDDAVKGAASLPGPLECTSSTSLGDGGDRARSDGLRRQLAEARADQLVRAVEPGLRLAQHVEREADRLGLWALRAEALVTLAGLQDDAGSFTSAQESYLEALVLAETHGQDALLAEASTGLMAISGGRLRRFTEAHSWEKIARTSLERAGLLEHEQEAKLFNTVGGVALFERSPDLAFASFQRALALRERLHGTEHVLVAETLHNLSAAYAHANRREEALDFAERALSLRERLLGPEHRDVALSLDALGRIVREAGDVQKGLELSTRAVALAERTLPPGHMTRAIFLNNLGLARSDCGDFRGAEEALERALAIKRKSLGEDHPGVGGALDNLVWVAVLRGDLGRAIALGEEVVRRFEHSRAEALGDVGEAYRRAGNPEEARLHFERALAMLAADADDRVEVQVLTHSAENEIAQGLRAKARERLERALEIGARARLPPQNLAEARWALARALSPAEADRRRRLALEARTLFEKTRRTSELLQVDRFLAGLADAGP